MFRILITLTCLTSLYSCSQGNNDIQPNQNIPVTPSQLQGTVVSANEIALSWLDNSTNETGFKVERKSNGTNWTIVGTVNVNITNFNDSGLTPNSSYTYRVYSYNSAGNSPTYSNEITLSTLNVISITTKNISDVLSSAVMCGGDITDNAGSPILERGVVWSTQQNPTTSLTTKTNDGVGNGSFDSQIDNLQPNTTYYVRAYARNANGTAYGNQIAFSTNNFNVYLTGADKVYKNTSSQNIYNGRSITFDGVNILATGNIITGTNNNAWQNHRAVLWKNGTQISLSSTPSYASSICVNGTDTYVAGVTSTSVGVSNIGKATQWKNGVETILSNLPSTTSGSFLMGSDFYVAGAIQINNIWCPVYWKNGTLVQLSNISSVAYGICVSGSDVYVTTSSGSSGFLYKNGVASSLPGSFSASTVIVNSGNVYVAGARNNQAGAGVGVWKNGVLMKYKFAIATVEPSMYIN